MIPELTELAEKTEATTIFLPFANGVLAAQSIAACLTIGIRRTHSKQENRR